jgi:hypothetical protein
MTSMCVLSFDLSLHTPGWTVKTLGDESAELLLQFGQSMNLWNSARECQAYGLIGTELTAKTKESATNRRAGSVKASAIASARSVFRRRAFPLRVLQHLLAERAFLVPELGPTANTPYSDRYMVMRYFGHSLCNGRLDNSSIA